LSLCAPPRALLRPRYEPSRTPSPVGQSARSGAAANTTVGEPAPQVEAESVPLRDAEPAPGPEAAPDTGEPEPSLEAEPASSVEPESEPQCPARDAFADFIQALVAVALEAGATRAAIWLPELLECGVIGCDAAQAEALAERGVLERTSAGLVPSRALVQTAQAWRQVLRAESDDLSACGASTLDAWGAELIGLLAGRTSVENLRRELRRRGVAAFGMLSLAA